jgi:catechol 2,3-dioxygenase-like lactoylglutathione lyase family enzyme
MNKIISAVSLIVLWLLGGALWPVGAAWAQVASPNPSGVAMGHLHYRVRDVEANKRFWIALGAAPTKLNETAVMKFPDVLIFLSKGESSGGAEGSVINHVGFRVPNVAKSFAQMKAGGYRVAPNENGVTGDVYTPEGERIELLEALSENVKFFLDGGRKDFEAERTNRKMTVPIAFHHIHYNVPESAVEKVQAWYVEMFGALPGRRFHYKAADLPGVNLNILGVTSAQAPTKGRMLDHIGFEIKNLPAFCKKLEARGVKFDEPYEKHSSGVATAYFTDPWGTYIELTEGLDRL